MGSVTGSTILLLFVEDSFILSVVSFVTMVDSFDSIFGFRGDP